MGRVQSESFWILEPKNLHTNKGRANKVKVNWNIYPRTFSNLKPAHIPSFPAKPSTSRVKKNMFINVRSRKELSPSIQTNKVEQFEKYSISQV